MSTQKFQMEMNLTHPDGETVIPVSMEFELDGNNLVGVKGLGTNGEEYTLSFIIREKEQKEGGDGCWICDEPPCPPNKPNWYNPCPVGGATKKPHP